MLRIILIIFLVLLVIGAFPAWPYSQHFGYFPSGIGGVLFITVIIFILTDRI